MTAKKGARRVSASMAAVLPDTSAGRPAMGQRRSSAGAICRGPGQTSPTQVQVPDLSRSRPASPGYTRAPIPGSRRDMLQPALPSLVPRLATTCPAIISNMHCITLHLRPMLTGVGPAWAQNSKHAIIVLLFTYLTSTRLLRYHSPPQFARVMAA